MNPTELNRDLGGACNANRLELHLRGSACNCPIVTLSPVFLNCAPDVRAGDLLAEEGMEAPANEPCGMQRSSNETNGEVLQEVHRYRYDADGRLRLIDVYDAGDILTLREVFSYEPNGYLKEALKIDPESGLIFQKRAFAYGADGLVATQEFDGYVDRVDGIVDWTAEYSLAGSSWTETFTYADANQGPRSFTYTYDEVALTVTTEDNVITLAEPLESPNQLFASPDEVDIPKILSSGGISFEYDDDGRLMRVTYPSYLDTARDEYLYSCP